MGETAQRAGRQRRTIFRHFATKDAPRAALHARTRREMRAATVSGRRILFAQALAPAIGGLPGSDLEMIGIEVPPLHRQSRPRI
ncbi:hypothetical protein [Salipiger mangrovisoli]|uniref:TetR family transcriptional regulator n=1 Tax=Salipiger mangrovisoli TaxID=2865933 RepID=A0ABR9X5D3_9RHOB|nr:hypothetical protein [Salipiger mangrovisoli]MBE9638729.1 hypothetical protein [Salipiger mangrovisoli]